LLARRAAQELRRLRLLGRRARGGAGRALLELKAWQSAASRLDQGAPDLMVIVIDANCQGWSARRTEIAAAVDRSRFPRVVVGCPEPHIERWCLADPQAFTEVVGRAPPADPGKCERDIYKELLRRAIEDAGNIILADPMDHAPELVRAMSLYRAGRTQSSFKHFVNDLTAALRGLT
jgi:hypothetical protein